MLAACAKPPEKIEAVAIDDATYQNMTCEHINRQISSYEADYRFLAGQQQNAATADAIGVMVLGVPGGSLAGGDKETSIAVLKGQMASIKRVAARKSC